jgi:hypothetical protein
MIVTRDELDGADTVMVAYAVTFAEDGHGLDASRSPTFRKSGQSDH